MIGKDPKKCIQAIREELASHKQNRTWNIMSLLRDRGVIGHKWVFKMKITSSDEVARYKTLMDIRKNA